MDSLQSGTRDSGFGIRSDAAAASVSRPDDTRSLGRVIVEHVWPEIDGGRFPIKRTVGEHVTVSADVFADGHDLVAGAVKYRHVPAGPPAASISAGPPAAGPALRASNDSRPGPVAQRDPRATDPATAGPTDWSAVPLIPRDDDRWEGTFTVSELGEYEYTIEAWIDRFGSWLKGLVAKAEAGQDVSSELLEGAELIEAAAVAGRPSAAALAGPPSAAPDLRTSNDSRPGAVAQQDPGATDPAVIADNLRLLEIADTLRSNQPQVSRVWTARDPWLRALMDARPDRRTSTTCERTLTC